MTELEALEEEVKTNLEFISNELSEANSPENGDIDGIVGHGMQLAAIIALTGEVYAKANKLLKMKELRYMNENQHIWDKPTVLKKLMEGTLAAYYANVLLADRFNAAITHKMDFYRSVLSKHKEEIRASIQFNQTQRQ